MAIHFTEQELLTRRENACAAMAANGLDGLLIFKQESMFYLTGYDTFGYCWFQCMYLGADGDLFLLTRAPDLRQAQHTSIIKDIHVWVDRDGADAMADLKALLQGRGLVNKNLGVEWDAYGLSAAYGRRLDAALDGFVTLNDASVLVSEMRVIKSPAELDFIRRAAELSDDALTAAEAIIGPGADEGEILAAMQGAVFKGGGDYPGNEFIIGSGRDALLCRYKAGRRNLDPEDQLTLEWAGAYRHYHAAMMRTLYVGKAHPDHVHMHSAARDALLACEEALKPGQPISDVFDAHAHVLDAAGLQEHRLNACGYSMGATFAPMWMDFPMFYAGNPVIAQPGMAFFIHIIVANSETGRAQCLGRSSIVTETGSETVSKASIDLFVAI